LINNNIRVNEKKHYIHTRYNISLNERTIKRLMFVKPFFLSQEQCFKVLNRVGIKTGRDRGDERIILLKKTNRDSFKMIFCGNIWTNSCKRIDNLLDVKKLNVDRLIQLRSFQLGFELTNFRMGIGRKVDIQLVPNLISRL